MATFTGRVFKTTEGNVKQAWLVVAEKPRDARLVVVNDDSPDITNAGILEGRLWVDRYYNDDESATIEGTAWSDGGRNYIVVT